LALSLKNQGLGVLNGNVAATVGDGTVFTVTTGGGQFALASSKTRQIKIRFTPDGSGTYNQKLEITTDDPAKPVISVTLAGISH